MLGEFGRFTRRDHPADDVAAEDIEDDVEVVAHPGVRAFELGYIPAPHLVRGGEQFRLGIHRMDALAAPLAALVLGGEQPMQGADRAVITASSSSVA